MDDQFDCKLSAPLRTLLYLSVGFCLGVLVCRWGTNLAGTMSNALQKMIVSAKQEHERFVREDAEAQQLTRKYVSRIRLSASDEEGVELQKKLEEDLNQLSATPPGVDYSY